MKKFNWKLLLFFIFMLLLSIGLMLYILFSCKSMISASDKVVICFVSILGFLFGCVFGASLGLNLKEEKEKKYEK